MVCTLRVNDSIRAANIIAQRLLIRFSRNFSLLESFVAGGHPNNL